MLQWHAERCDLHAQAGVVALHVDRAVGRVKVFARIGREIEGGLCALGAASFPLAQHGLFGHAGPLARFLDVGQVVLRVIPGSRSATTDSRTWRNAEPRLFITIM